MKKEKQVNKKDDLSKPQINPKIPSRELFPDWDKHVQFLRDYFREDEKIDAYELTEEDRKKNERIVDWCMNHPIEENSKKLPK
jgi:hypothetical protein